MRDPTTWSGFSDADVAGGSYVGHFSPCTSRVTSGQPGIPSCRHALRGPGEPLHARTRTRAMRREVGVGVGVGERRSRNAAVEGASAKHTHACARARARTIFPSLSRSLTRTLRPRFSSLSPFSLARPLFLGAPRSRRILRPPRERKHHSLAVRYASVR